LLGLTVAWSIAAVERPVLTPVDACFRASTTAPDRSTGLPPPSRDRALAGHRQSALAQPHYVPGGGRRRLAPASCGEEINDVR